MDEYKIALTLCAVGIAIRVVRSLIGFATLRKEIWRKALHEYEQSQEALKKATRRLKPPRPGPTPKKPLSEPN